ncbi:hypothetical protein Tco_1258029 [Tanacetum coccineum]
MGDGIGIWWSGYMRKCCDEYGERVEDGGGLGMANTLSAPSSERKGVGAGFGWTPGRWRGANRAHPHHLLVSRIDFGWFLSGSSIVILLSRSSQGQIPVYILGDLMSSGVSRQAVRCPQPEEYLYRLLVVRTR